MSEVSVCCIGGIQGGCPSATCGVMDDLIVLAHLVEESRGELLRRHGVTPAEYFILLSLLSAGESSMKTLGHMCRRDPTHLSRDVTRMVDRGLLFRRRPADDRRVVLLRLTEPGEALGLELSRVVPAHARRLMEGIDREDMESFRRVVEAVLGVLEYPSRTSDELSV